MNRTMVQDGQVVSICGHLLKVSDIKVTMEEGRKLLRFTGHCTDDEGNRYIRGTGYDGGRYGWYID